MLENGDRVDGVVAAAATGEGEGEQPALASRPETRPTAREDAALRRAALRPSRTGILLGCGLLASVVAGAGTIVMQRTGDGATRPLTFAPPPAGAVRPFGPMAPAPSAGDRSELTRLALSADLRARGVELLMGPMLLAQASDGGRPFAAELAVVMRAVEADGELIQALDPLMRTAERGVPSLGQLAARFAGLAAALTALDTSGAGRRATVLMREVALLVGIGSRSPTAVDVLVGRARGELDRGSLGGAIKVLGALGPAHGVLARPWIEQATARIDLDSRLVGYRNLVLRRLLDVTGY